MEQIDKKKKVKQNIQNLNKKEIANLVNKNQEKIEKEDDEKEDKNKGSQLDGVLRDVLTWWENVIYKNAVNK